MNINRVVRLFGRTVSSKGTAAQLPKAQLFPAQLFAVSPSTSSIANFSTVRNAAISQSKIPSIASPLPSSTISMDDDSVEADSTTIPYDVSFVTDPVQLMRIICEKHNKNGKVFVLPWGDPNAINVAAESFKFLMSEGVLPEFLFDACMKRENLFVALTKKGPDLIDIVRVIMNCAGITYENAIRLVSSWTDELLEVGEEGVTARINVFLQRGVLSGERFFGVICNCPPLLFARDPQKMDMTLEIMSEFFPPDEMNAIMLASPRVALYDAEEVALRYEYIYYHMAIEPSDFPECIQWHDLPLEEIMARHELLRRTGKYTLPDPKRPQLQMENPPMYRIFDTDDMEFATQVAGITKEEWTLFRQLFAKEQAQKNMDRPYERVKPSLRKAYERKREAERARRMHEEMEMDE